MTKVATSEDFRALDLPEDATPEEARRAYHRMKALYADGALATYSLLENDQRREILDRIERAYMRIARDLRGGLPECCPPPGPHETGLPGSPGPGVRIGPYLRQRRETLGYTIREIAEKTRIRATYLEHIEEERFQDLPAPVYIRGFILEFARTLGLPEPEKISEAFLSQANSRES